MPTKMTENELLSLVGEAERQAAIFSGDLMKENTKYLEAYLGDKTGDFEAIPNQSSVVSTDVADVVEADMPSLARVFLGSGNIMSFTPSTENKAEVAEADEKTKYVNWIIRSQPGSFQLIHNWLKDAEIQKNGVVKYFMEEQKEVEMVEYEGVDLDELVAIQESLLGSSIDKIKVDITEQEENIEAQTFNIKFRVTTEKNKVSIINIPPESFLMTRNASSIEDAEMVGDRVRKTRSELLSDGFDKDLISRLPTVSDRAVQESNIASVRNQDQGGSVAESTISEWASEFVEISDLYIKIDFDGDGIAERRHIMISGNEILVNEYFNHVPYASLSAILMPHKAIGRSRAEITYQTQLQKTAIIRGMNDNMYMVNNPRHIVHGDVDLDDMLTVRTNGVVRLDDDSKILPQQAVFPLQVPYIGQQSLQVLQYNDQARAQTSGTLLASQGLNADSITDETATRFNGVQEAGTAKVELMCRNYAETGFRKLYEGIAWLVSRYQDSATEFRVLGKALTVNPKGWKYNHYVETSVGLGAGDNETLIEARQGIYTLQQQLKAQGSMLVDDVGIYKNLIGLMDGVGLRQSEGLLNNPEEDAELVMAHNEQLNKMVLELQEQLQQVQNPLAEAEQIKQEAFLVKAQSDAQIKVAQLQSNNEQFQAKLIADSKKASEDLALKLTELEVKAGQDLNGAMQDNMLVFDPAIGDFI
tara:strand:+ start:2309 stop:4411 length:2103 start_codon:yes stop_codon:yes gene_type:complete